jgi:hypothetical protein
MKTNRITDSRVLSLLSSQLSILMVLKEKFPKANHGPGKVGRIVGRMLGNAGD